MKTQRELNQHDYFDLIKNYVRVKEMCDAYNSEHGTRVQPYECVRGDKGQVYTCHPNFTKLLAHRKEFAVAILYDERANFHRPVWIGDVIYTDEKYRHFIVCEGSTHNNLIVKRCPDGNLTNMHISHASWHKPHKRTFEINGVELPCPIANHEGSWILTVNAGVAGNRNRDFTFKSQIERNCVADKILRILDEAMDK